MTATDSITTLEEEVVEQPTQKQIVEDLISSKKKSSTKQEIAEFTDAWSKLARKEGITDETLSLLIDGFSIAGAVPLFTMMKSDDSCLAALRGLKKLTVIKENNQGATLRIYVHLFALAVNANRNWDCINSIVSSIPSFACNKEGKPFGTNSSTVSKYLFKVLDVEKARIVLADANLVESTANKLVEVLKPAFKEAIERKKPMRREIAAIKVLEPWLKSKASSFSEETAIAKLGDSSIEKYYALPRAETDAQRDIQDEPSRRSAVVNSSKKHEELTYETVIASIRHLASVHTINESKLATAEISIKTRDESIEKLQRELEEANRLIEVLKEANSKKQQEIENANCLIEKLQRELEEAKSMAESRAEMISMLDKNRDQKGSEALARVASKLKADFGDFKEYEDEIMTVELGEIVKLQLGQVFETLKSAGVKL